MDPVTTQPTDGEILKIWETDDGSISLSYQRFSFILRGAASGRTNRHFLLGENDGAILASDADGRDICGSDRFKCILYHKYSK